MAALINRVAPELSRFLQAHYPQHHPVGTTPILEKLHHLEDLPIIQEEVPTSPLPQVIDNNLITSSPEIQTIQEGFPTTNDDSNKPPPHRITLPSDCLNTYREKMVSLQNNMVLGHITRCTPGARRLSQWAKIHLHRPFKQLTVRSNNYF